LPGFNPMLKMNIHSITAKCAKESHLKLSYEMLHLPSVTKNDTVPSLKKKNQI